MCARAIETSTLWHTFPYIRRCQISTVHIRADALLHGRQLLRILGLWLLIFLILLLLRAGISSLAFLIRLVRLLCCLLWLIALLVRCIGLWPIILITMDILLIIRRL